MTLQRRVSEPTPDLFDPIAVAADLSRRFAATAPDFDRSGEIPRANFAALAEAGLLKLTIPREAGGHGAGLETAIRVVEWIGKGEPSTALILAMHLINHATVVRTWPPEIATKLQAESLSASRSSTPCGSSRNWARRRGAASRRPIGRRTANGWRVSGHKLYSTGIPVLRWLAVWARTDEAEPRVGIFLVPSDRPGHQDRADLESSRHARHRQP